MTAYRTAALAALLVAACKGSPSAGDAAVTVDSTHAAVTVPEVHLLDLADSTQVWLVEGRESHASDGSRCIERTIQLRKGPLKIPVPLLYTASMPRVVDGKLIADLSKDCVVGASYAIDPKTGQPTLVTPAAR